MLSVVKLSVHMLSVVTQYMISDALLGVVILYMASIVSFSVIV
jgi:hypothetical protein